MIVIPMAGRSRRFAEAGYEAPKFMLPLGGQSVFAHALESFAGLFETLPFLFVLRAGDQADDFVRAECSRLGVLDARIVALDADTAGQAETVALGLAAAHVEDRSSVTVFNIDTFRPGFAFPSEPWAAASDGWLEVFRGSGANWSYVRAHPARPDREPLVAETAEKRPISDLCCTGLYHFSRAGDFRAALEAERARPSSRELYVAPLYNHLIAAGRRIHYRLIERAEVVFCGVPAEYEALAGGLSPDAGEALV